MKCEMKIIALRETPKGYRLTALSVIQCYHGEYRKYSDDTQLFYKKWDYAKAKCLSFFKAVYKNVELKYYGTITNEMFRGEIATPEDNELFNN